MDRRFSSHTCIRLHFPNWAKSLQILLIRGNYPRNSWSNLQQVETNQTLQEISREIRKRSLQKLRDFHQQTSEAKKFHQVYSTERNEAKNNPRKA